MRGRSYTLTINYRTSHQIRQQADRLLPFKIADVDGNVVERQGTVSIFNGPPPLIDILKTPMRNRRRWVIGLLPDWLKDCD